MYNRFDAALIVVISINLLTALPAFAADVPPELISKLKSMPPSEQAALAEQYGIDLEQLRTGPIEREDDARPTLGAPGEVVAPIYSVEPDRDARPRDTVLEDEEGRGPELERFGANLFDSEISTFAPVDNIPVPEGYRLGVGDELFLLLVGKDPGEFELLIDRDGSVNLPRLGRLSLSGLTFPEAKKLIEARVNDQLIGSEALLSMGSLRSINVFMSGEVMNRGNYSVSSLTTLSQAIYVAGGISQNGSYRNIELKRRGDIVGSFDIYDLLLFGDNSGDVRLQNGDVVFVPVVGPQISISGEVVRPAIYEFKEGDTIGSVIEMAGGKLARGYSKQASLNRYLQEDPLPSLSALDLDVDEQMNSPAIDGDELSVRAVPARVSNPIEITGVTRLEGIVGWTDGIRIADIFKDIEADFEPKADLELALVIRRRNKFNDIEVLEFSPAEALKNPESPNNIGLQAFDRIVILPLPEDLIPERDEPDAARLELIVPIVRALKQQSEPGEPASVIRVSGAVMLPGEYPLLSGATVMSAISLAGGFRDNAYLPVAELRRIESSSGSKVEFEIVELNLLATSKDRQLGLAGRDTLHIKRIPNWSVGDTVQLSGEFVFPGEYTISRGESASNVIRRAGGFTNEAFVSGSRYVSASAKKQQASQLDRILQNLNRRMRESTGGRRDVSEASIIDEDALGRVVVDLGGAAKGLPDADFIVENGDTIFVPKFSNTVTVVGEVFEPGTFRFSAGRSVQDYIATAGGETTLALGKKAYLLKADGTVRHTRGKFFRTLVSFEEDPGALDVSPGDIIVVPTDLDYEPPLARINSITNVVFQSITSIAALFTIGNM